jgi:hypothetical protein
MFKYIFACKSDQFGVDLQKRMQKVPIQNANFISEISIRSSSSCKPGHNVQDAKRSYLYLISFFIVIDLHG